MTTITDLASGPKLSPVEQHRLKRENADLRQQLLEGMT